MKNLKKFELNRLNVLIVALFFTVITALAVNFTSQGNPLVFAAGCGDGSRDWMTEGCDDGDTDSGDGCSATCAVESGWVCDGWVPDVCTEIICGNGLTTFGYEECDDGGTAAGDGCSATCTVESNWECGGSPSSSCYSSCGDATLDTGETCDDGNTSLNDGCSATCTVEAGWECLAEPSTCALTGSPAGQLERIESLTLNQEYMTDFTCSVIDTVNGYAYFGTHYGKVAKVRLSDFTKVGTLSLPNNINCETASIDTTGGYAYFVGEDTGGSGYVEKVDINPSRTFESIATISPGSYGSMHVSVIDTTGGYMYIGTSYHYTSGTVAKVLKIDINPSRPFQLITALSMSAGEERLETAVIDPADGYAYFSNQYPGNYKIIKVDINPAHTFARISAGTTTVTGIYTAVIDTVGNYAYYGTYHSPAKIIKVALGTGIDAPSQVGSEIILNTGENAAYSAGIDASGGYAYFGMDATPGKVVKVSLATLARVSAVTLDTWESSLGTGVIDTANNFIYFGTQNDYYYGDQKVIKVALGGGGAPTRVGALTWDDLELYLRSAVIDNVHGYAYIIGGNFESNKVVKVRLSDYARVGVLTLDPYEINVYTSVIDVDNGYAYLGAYNNDTNENEVIKIALGDDDDLPTRVGVVTLNSNEGYLRSSVIDTVNGYAYFGTETSPGKVVKVALGDGDDPPTRLGALTLNSGESYLYSAVIDTANGYAYFGTETSPGKVVKVALGVGNNLPTRIGAVTLNNGEDDLYSAVIDAGNGYAYFGTNTEPGYVVKVALGSGISDPTRIGAVTASEYLTSAVIDTVNGYAYFGDDNFPANVTAIRLANLTRAGVAVMPEDEYSLYSAVIDTASGYAYFAAYSNDPVGQVVKVSLLQAVHGDGITEGSEECDDGDTSSGDGCSASNTIESGWGCSGQPSVCYLLSSCIDPDSDGYGEVNTDLSQCSGSASVADNCSSVGNTGQEDTYGEVHNAKLEFSSKQGQDNWYYQYWDGSSYNNMTDYNVPNRWWYVQPLFSYYFLNADGGHPLGTGDPVRKWLSDYNGTIRLTGNARDNDGNCGNGVIVKIYKNSTSLWERTIANNDLSGYDYDLSVNVVTGDSIYFMINANGTDTSCDSTTFDSTIAYGDGIGDVCAPFTPQVSNTATPLRHVYFTDNNTGWAVGVSGTILHTVDGGDTWSAQTSGTANNLSGIYFVNSTTGWAVGDGGTILKTTNGTSWSHQDVNSSYGLYDVHFTDASYGWAVGGSPDAPYNIILYTENGGVSWTLQDDNGADACALNHISCTDANTCWANSDWCNFVVYTDDAGATGWHQQNVNASTDYMTVATNFINSSTGWVVGDYWANDMDNEYIAKTTNGGDTWSTQTVPGTGGYLLAVDFTDTNNGWSTGRYGRIYHTANGGSLWSAENSGTLNELSDVFFTDTNNGWFVGDNGTILKYTAYECSNGEIDGAEACDDGDASSGDGCSAACTVESGYSCNGEPSVCSSVPSHRKPYATLFPTAYGTTNFDALSGAQFETVSAMKLANQHGFIHWTGAVNSDFEDYDSNVRIGDGFVSLNMVSLLHTVSIDSPARVSLNVSNCDSYTAYYAPGFRSSLAEIKANGQVCNTGTTPACTNITCVDNVLSFDVPHFDGYGGQGGGTPANEGITTTLNISNATPVITATPSDGGSDAATPTNVGSDVTFSGTGKDINGDQYYLAICKTDSVTVGDNAPPTCSEWKISPATDSNTPVSMTYTALSGDNESNAWFAFVCDKVSGGGSCFPASGDQGFALGTVTFSDVPADGNTMTIDSVLYEFNTAGGCTQSPNVCADMTASEDGQEAASALVTASGGASDAVHMTARANVVYVYADSKGTGGNSVGMSIGTCPNCSVSGANLAGGSDANASPFKVNHAGTFGTAIVTDTSVGTVEPGDTMLFRFLAGGGANGITDSDTDSSQDTMNIYICTDATTGFNYSANTCTGGTMICSDLGINPVLDESGCAGGADLISVPAPHGSFGFKVYIEDNHDFPATGTHDQTYTVTDVPPVVTNTMMDFGTIENPHPSAGGSGTIEFIASITDDNGDNDVTGVNGVFYDDTAINLDNGACTASENNCYLIPSCTLSDVNGGADNELTATCDSTVWFNANASFMWRAHTNPSDGTTTVTDSTDSGGVENPALQGIDVVQSGIAYGTIVIGGTSGAKETSMGNVGNQTLDIYLSGTNMTAGSYTIPAGQQKWYHNSGTFDWDASATGAGPYILVEMPSSTGDVTGCLNRNIAVRTVHGTADTNESVFWKLRIPADQHAGSYIGQNTFSTTSEGTCVTGAEF